MSYKYVMYRLALDVELNYAKLTTS